MSTTPELTILTLEATYHVLTPVELPEHPGTTFRGALGRALHALSCTTAATTCDGCRRVTRCVFGSVWSYSATTERGARVEVANAYTIVPEPGTSASIRAGGTLRFAVRLFGVARGAWSTVVEALKLAGGMGFGAGRGMGAGECELTEVFATGERDRRLLVYERGRGVVPLALAPARHAPYPAFGLAGRLRLELLTPLALSPRHVPGQPPPRAVLERFDPSRMTELLMRRWRDLVNHHEMVPVDWDVGALEEDARAVRVVEQPRFERIRHYSEAQRRWLPLNGLVGPTIVDHVTPALAGLWQLAELVHVGRGAVKGLGRIRLEPL